MGFYKKSRGEDIYISNRKARETIIKDLLGYKRVNKRSIRAYEKYYDIERNKRRLYERLNPYAKKQSIIENLYKQAKAKKYYNYPSIKRQGLRYKQNIINRYIHKLPSISSGKKGQIYLEKAREDLKDKYGSRVDERFKALIENNDQAKAIAEKFADDPFKREKALTDYANKLNAKIDEQLRLKKQGIKIPRGETIGSSSEIDFDISQYD